jgi:YD repeat-containing protein
MTIQQRTGRLEYQKDSTGQTIQKTYAYTDSAGNVQPGPTQSAYRFWNGSAYDTKTSTTEYGVSGRAVRTTDANSRSMWYTYDDLGRPLRTIYAVDTAGNPSVYTENTYDCCNLTTSEDEDHRETRYKYDTAGRVTDVWTNITGQSDGTPLVHYEYDGFGNVYTVTTRSDANALRTTSYVYDANNRVVETRHPGYPYSPLGTEYFAYDDVGNLIGKKDGSAVVTAYEYDSLNRLVKVDYEHGYWPVQTITSADVTYSYYGGSRLRHEMTDSVGTSHYDYDVQDRLTSYTPPLPEDHDPIEYTYNALGQKTSVTNGSFAGD